MLREPSRHDGLSNNQAARDLQRERQRQERAQMLVSDEAGLSPNIQDLFNAPVKVKPSVEDATSIEIRKTFGSYDSARPFLIEKNGALQGRLIGVDQTVNSVSGGAASSSSGQTQQATSVDPRPPVTTTASSTGSQQKSHILAGSIPHRPFTSTTNSVAKADYQSLFKHIPPASHTSSTQKGPLLGTSQPTPPSLTYVPGPGQTPLLNHIQNTINTSWSIPTPLSPFPTSTPVRKNNKLNNLTLPITFVNTSSLNTTTTTNSDIGGDLFKLPAKSTFSQNQSSSAANISNQSSATNVSSGTAVKGEVKSVGSIGSSGAPSASIDKPAQQHTFKKPLERNDSRLELDSIIREMTDVRSPLAAILPKESSPKKVATRRSSKSDERAFEMLEEIKDTKMNMSPLSTTGMNSSSSSSSSDSSDSDSDSDSSSGSERTTPSTTPVKTAPEPTRSPTERESWGLSSFVGGIRKENALIEAASTSSSSLEPAKNKNIITLEISDSISDVLKPEFNLPSSTSGLAKLPTNPNTIILDSSKALTKSSGFIKPSVPQSKTASKDSASHKGTSPGEKGTVLSKSIMNLPPTVKPSPALLAHKDPTLSGSSSEDELPTIMPHSTKEKEKEPEKVAAKGKPTSKRLSTTTIEAAPAKKPRRSSQASQHQAPAVPEKIVLKPEEKQGKNKSLDRNKNDMIGKLFFRPKKEKAEEGGKGGKDKDKNGGVTSANPRDEKTGKYRGKSPTSNRVSAKDSGKKRNSSPGNISTNNAVSSGRANGEVKGNSEKLDKVGHMPTPTTGDSKSKRSASPAKGVLQKTTGISNTNTLAASSEKANKSKHSSSKTKKSDRESLKGGRVSESSKTKASTSPKAKPSSDSKHAKQKESAKHKAKTDAVAPKTSASTTSSKPSKSSTSAGKSTATSKTSKSEAKSMPPPPPLRALSPLSHSLKDSRSSKRDSKTADSKPPSSLVVRIPVNVLPRGVKPPKKTESSASNSATTITTQKDGKHSRDDKKEEIRHKTNVSMPSLVGSSVEDVTDTHIVPSKSQRSSGGYDQLSKPTSKDHSTSSSSSKSHKRSKSHSHSSSKKPRLKDDAEVEVKIPPEKNSATEMSSVITAYTPGSTPAKTPPDPPDSSLNPTHSSSPTLTLPQPQYLSYFEKGDPQEDFFSRDQSYYLNQAKTLKHKADKEEPGLPQIITYMESSLFFILTGILIEKFGSADEAQGMYEQTFGLIRQIAVRPRSGTLGDDLQEVKLLVLTFRIQSLLSLQLYKVKAPEIINLSHNLMEYFDSKGAHHQELGLPVTHSPRTVLSTPSPRSPVLSPAGSGPASVGSGTASSIHSPHHVTSQQHVVIPKYLYQKISQFYAASSTLITSHEHWNEADNYVERFHVQDFFISIERMYGPLTLHSSLLDLVRYVRCGLKNLKSMMESS